MNMMESPAQMPDTSNLPEFFVTDVATEIDGSNVRLVCGARRGGIVHWLYSVVLPADRLQIILPQCSLAANVASGFQDLTAHANH